MCLYEFLEVYSKLSNNPVLKSDVTGPSLSGHGFGCMEKSVTSRTVSSKNLKTHTVFQYKECGNFVLFLERDSLNKKFFYEDLKIKI